MGFRTYTKFRLKKNIFLVLFFIVNCSDPSTTDDTLNDDGSLDEENTNIVTNTNGTNVEETNKEYSQYIYVKKTSYGLSGELTIETFFNEVGLVEYYITYDPNTGLEASRVYYIYDENWYLIELDMGGVGYTYDYEPR